MKNRVKEIFDEIVGEGNTVTIKGKEYALDDALEYVLEDKDSIKELIIDLYDGDKIGWFIDHMKGSFMAFCEHLAELEGES